MNSLFSRLVRHGSFVSNAIRRISWVFDGLTAVKLFNHARLFINYVTGSDCLKSYPVVVKIETSSLCNLKCTICVHADKESVSLSNRYLIEDQTFTKNMVMSLEKYKGIIDKIKGKSSAVSLYWLGDPLMNKNIVSYCRYARDSNLSVHINTNFSFKLSDKEIIDLLRSGITMFTVCVDGFSQSTYSITRVNGNFEWVKNNVERLVKFKDVYGVGNFKVEIQYIKFQHNVHELEHAIKWAKKIGIDDIYHFWGDLNNYVDYSASNLHVNGVKEKGLLPKCYWPTFFSVINYNGDVYPCCTYRLDEVNSCDKKRNRSFGNIFTDDFDAIWNGSNYKKARTYSKSPGYTIKDPAYIDHFCYKCPALNDSNWNEIRISAEHHDFLEIYQINGRKRIRLNR